MSHFNAVVIANIESLTDTSFVAPGGLGFAAILVAQGLPPPVVQYTLSELP